MENNIAKSLLDKYTAGTCTNEECAAIEAWYAQWNDELQDTIPEEKLQLAFDRIYNRLPKEERRLKLTNLHAWAAAAIIIITASFGIWFFMLRQDQRSTDTTVSNLKRNDIRAGGNKAILTLADGKTIDLSDAKTGLIIDASKITYTDGSKVQTTSGDPALHNKKLTVSTPRGGTYEVVLPDGTRVWLNAASSLIFPSNFKDLAQRKVVLNGEAYFEVAKNKLKPFIVATDKQEVEVLGTHFNINNYADEAIVKTTLLEGSVKVSNLLSNTSQPLKPGQQSILKGKTLKVVNTDPDEDIAWKNGNFNFNDEDLESIMRKVSRWYDVEIYYEGKLPKMSFLGTLSRSKNLSALLQVLKESGKVHFKVEGRRITVMQ